MKRASLVKLAIIILRICRRNLAFMIKSLMLWFSENMQKILPTFSIFESFYLVLPLEIQ